MGLTTEDYLEERHSHDEPDHLDKDSVMSVVET
jgi:hypothetical protein